MAFFSVDRKKQNIMSTIYRWKNADGSETSFVLGGFENFYLGSRIYHVGSAALPPFPRIYTFPLSLCHS